MAIDTALIQQLREKTGAGIMDAKRALEETGGSLEAAVEHLRKQGQKVAAKKQERATHQGVVGHYLHSNARIGALVALACESDFVANTEGFRGLAHDIAMHVAATDPTYLAPEQVPADVVEKERAIYREQLLKEGKPEAMLDKIIDGKLKKFYAEVCLLPQPFIKDDAKTIEELIKEQVVKLGENIKVTDFKRLAL